MLLERGGVTYGIFGLMGENSAACAPASDFVLGDVEENARRCVDALKMCIRDRLEGGPHLVWEFDGEGRPKRPHNRE